MYVLYLSSKMKCTEGRYTPAVFYTTQLLLCIETLPNDFYVTSVSSFKLAVIERWRNITSVCSLVFKKHLWFWYLLILRAILYIWKYHTFNQLKNVDVSVVYMMSLFY